MSLYGIAKSVIKPVTIALWPQRVEGLQHIPAHGPVIIACNHHSNIDPLFLGVVVPRPIIFIAKQELFAQGNIAQRMFSRALRAIGQVSVDRRPGQSSQEAMSNSLDVLADDNVFGIFPEGSRSPDGRLYKGQTGLAWLALTSGAPVVPAALSGTRHIRPKGRRIPALRRVGVRFGPPVDLSSWKGQADKARARREATEAIMADIQRLSGQERVARFAASAKAEAKPLNGPGKQ
ncbi:lysophospholipid acyltransferase family protein [Nocardiopsis ansamitocini]|uniref:1-acyl-sn-glycerol-3-phosphate acyltransferase n=1 Tax=Nocardiopsis ansamitocini TaxID=1670832 RepID=A0A9W6P288_9ACTN|nr:lysophospholipid acyltransferase family protein [Nocardiopsis ansamitocini]GLU45771.1 1-acyl-sn-glycerol-3-phosphate acyltransferase [Nocardiopsis ansamitocini]